MKEKVDCCAGQGAGEWAHNRWAVDEQSRGAVSHLITVCQRAAAMNAKAGSRAIRGLCEVCEPVSAGFNLMDITLTPRAAI